METPLERANKRWENHPYKETISFVVQDEDGSPGIWVEIDRDGWVRIDDNAASFGAGCRPDVFKKICEWFLGISS
jgi:hypothetical protein